MNHAARGMRNEAWEDGLSCLIPHAPCLLSRRFLNLPSPDAPRTNIDSFDGAVDDGADALQVRHPAAARHVVGVADPISEHRSLAADFAHFGHLKLLLK